MITRQRSSWFTCWSTCSRRTARLIMLETHDNGIGTCGLYPYDVATTKVTECSTLHVSSSTPYSAFRRQAHRSNLNACSVASAHDRAIPLNSRCDRQV